MKTYTVEIDGASLSIQRDADGAFVIPLAWRGIGSALKPAWEPVVVARKPFKGTIAANVMAHGTGALNIDGCRVAYESDEDKAAAAAAAEQRSRQAPNRVDAHEWGMKQQNITAADFMRNTGRWPANLVHDGSPEVLACFPETGASSQHIGQRSGKSAGTFGAFAGQNQVIMGHDDNGGSAARFFYTAKADASDRLGSKHPTVKPVDLMRWLCRLVTPPGGRVLDPFAGSGTTGMACMAEGFDAILIEREAQFVADIKRRIAHVKGEDAPLFAGKEAVA